MRRLLFLVVALVIQACSGNSNSPSSTGNAFAQLAGNWTGNLQSSNFPTVAITLQLSQTSGAVTGTWTSSSAATDWTGTVSGTASANSFTGMFTVSSPSAAAGGCNGTATVNGAAGGATLTWTSPGFTGSCTGEPANLTLNLQR
jgi:hypothetical protein